MPTNLPEPGVITRLSKIADMVWLSDDARDPLFGLNWDHVP